jgi:hypothetical protein|tara:strand:- start:582 stop:968 length:387 start_codon:yes stop_codon:yes gene_type:complete
MLPFLGPIVNGIFSVGKTYLNNKAEEKKAIHDRKITQIKQDGNWDEIQARNSNNSWKDEYLTIILTLPFVAMFLAVVFEADEMVMRFKLAFKVLDEDVPDEYWYLLSVVVAASFGVKKVIDVIKAKKP